MLLQNQAYMCFAKKKISNKMIKLVVGEKFTVECIRNTFIDIKYSLTACVLFQLFSMRRNCSAPSVFFAPPFMCGCSEHF